MKFVESIDIALAADGGYFCGLFDIQAAKHVALEYSI